MIPLWHTFGWKSAFRCRATTSLRHRTQSTDFCLLWHRTLRTSPRPADLPPGPAIRPIPLLHLPNLHRRHDSQPLPTHAVHFCQFDSFPCSSPSNHSYSFPSSYLDRSFLQRGVTSTTFKRMDSVSQVGSKDSMVGSRWEISSSCVRDTMGVRDKQFSKSAWTPQLCQVGSIITSWTTSIYKQYSSFFHL